MFRRLIEGLATLPPEAQDMFEQMERPRRRRAGARVRLRAHVFGVVAGAIFGLLGGVLGAAMFRKDPPPAQTQPPAPTDPLAPTERRR